MKKQFLLIFIFIFCLAGIVAPMPITHFYDWTESTKNPISSELYNACMKYPDLCFTGDVLEDVSVIYYFIDKSKYSATHSPSFCRELIENAANDQELACAVGGCMHLPQDLPSHTLMVPGAIKNSKLVNNVIHIFAEQKVDNWVVSNNPGIKNEVIEKLSDYKTCIPVYKKAMLGEPAYGEMSDSELESLFDKFITEYQNGVTGYDVGFKTKSFMVNLKTLPTTLLLTYSTILLFFSIIFILLAIKVFRKEAKIRHYVGLVIFLLLTAIFGYIFFMNLQGRGFEAIINFVTPLSNLVPLPFAQEELPRLGIQNTVELLTQGETWLSGKDPDGFKELLAADQSIKIWDYFILGALVLVLLWYVWYLLKRNEVSINPIGGYNL